MRSWAIHLVWSAAAVLGYMGGIAQGAQDTAAAVQEHFDCKAK